MCVILIPACHGEVLILKPGRFGEMTNSVYYFFISTKFSIMFYQTYNQMNILYLKSDILIICVILIPACPGRSGEVTNSANFSLLST